MPKWTTQPNQTPPTRAEAGAGCQLPFGLGRQLLPDPGRTRCAFLTREHPLVPDETRSTHANIQSISGPLVVLSGETYWELPAAAR